MARISYRDTYLLLDLQLAFWSGDIEETDTRDATEAHIAPLAKVLGRPEP